MQVLAFIGMLTLAGVFGLLILMAIGAVVVLAGRDDELGMSMFSVGWGFDDMDDE